MKDFVIIADSTSDLHADLREQYQIDYVRMNYVIDGVEYPASLDWENHSSREFYDMMRNGKRIMTTQVTREEYTEKFKSYLEQGKDVLYISFSSGMSGSYQAACLAARDICEEYPDANVEVIDTFAGCVGLGMLTYLAAKRKQMGESMAQVAEYIKNIRLNINHFFMVEDLGYIQKTGRISTISAIMGTALGIRPIFKLDNDGKVALVEKIRGRKIGVKNLINKVKTRCSQSEVFFVAHMDAEDDANNVAAQIRAEHPDAEVIIRPVGPILGNNTGPGARAVIFDGEER